MDRIESLLAQGLREYFDRTLPMHPVDAADAADDLAEELAALHMALSRWLGRDAEKLAVMQVVAAHFAESRNRDTRENEASTIRIAGAVTALQAVMVDVLGREVTPAEAADLVRTHAEDQAEQAAAR